MQPVNLKLSRCSWQASCGEVQWWTAPCQYPSPSVCVGSHLYTGQAVPEIGACNLHRGSRYQYGQPTMFP